MQKGAKNEASSGTEWREVQCDTAGKCAVFGNQELASSFRKASVGKRQGAETRWQRVRGDRKQRTQRQGV